MRRDPSVPKGFWEMALFGPSHLLHYLGRLLRPTMFRLGLSCFPESNSGSSRANLLFAIYKRVHSYSGDCARDGVVDSHMAETSGFPTIRYWVLQQSWGLETTAEL